MLKYGVNLQEDQTLVISVDVENKDFAVIVTEEAYELGAKEVVLNWRCSPIARQRLLHAKESVLERPANWIPEFYKQYIDDKAAFLSLISANPKALEGIPTNRISLQSRNLNKSFILLPYSDYELLCYMVRCFCTNCSMGRFTWL